MDFDRNYNLSRCHKYGVGVDIGVDVGVVVVVVVDVDVGVVVGAGSGNRIELTAERLVGASGLEPLTPAV